MPLAFVTFFARLQCCLSVATNNSSNSSARKTQWTRSKRIKSTRVRLRRWRRKAPSIQRSSNPPLHAVLHAGHGPIGRAQRHHSATGATHRPRQGHRHRTGAAAGVRRRAAAAAPTRPSLPYPAPPRARVPSGRYAQLSAEPADGSQLLPPRPPARGAAAPSSLVVPVRHFTAIISWTNFSKSFRHSTQERNLYIYPCISLGPSLVSLV